MTILLPVLREKAVLTKPESDLIKVLEDNIAYTRLEIEEASHLKKEALIRLWNSLVRKGVRIKEGHSSATTYRKAEGASLF